ncbi:MAG: type II secretion system GspH family protein [Pseudanabaena sp. CAN_BIN31]|nr:type II secretion system GspH family protein [Pseudanabaena sp. CAN_BIN31]
MDSQNLKRQIAPYLIDYLGNLIKIRRSPDSGFSILESLVAVAVVSILIVAIAPMVALSTSARVNARRIDQATQAGRAYVDGVRGGVIDTAGFPDNLVVSSPNATGQYTFESRVAPTTTTFPIATICTNPTLTVDNVPSGKVPGICVDSNGNGFSVNDPQDLFIQPMRSGPLRSVATVANDIRNQGFWLAVRVYRADALAGSALLRDGTEAACAISKTPFSSTASITCPIVTLRSQIFLSTVNPKNIDDIKSGTGLKTP